MFKEFKEFIMTGNVIEFAVAVIMAGDVGKVVNGFVSDIVMPIVGQFTGGKSFKDMFINLGEGNFKTLAEAQEAGVAVIAWGNWVDAIVNLVIIGLVMFMIVKAYNKVRKPAVVEEAPPAGPSDNDLLTEIRDLLKKN